ncbi:MAG TPA: hypothetical protein VL742_06575 [Casimicrobiaceae bacterium]|nr:hypothetical protein [Casimicrobiaceae bacterium]
MSNVWLDILQAWGTVAGSSATIAAMAPVYAAIWILSWLAAEQESPIRRERAVRSRSAGK